MKIYKKAAVDSNGIHRIQVSEASYDETTGAGVVKTGFVPFAADKQDAALAKLRANEWHFEFGAKNRASAGLYEVTLNTTPEPVEAPVEAEPATTVA